MNLSPIWVRFLGDHGIDAVHWSTVGAVAATDSEILEFAAAHQFVVFTDDLDFGMLLAASGTARPSVRQVRTKDVLPARIGNLLLQAIEKGRPHLDRGAIVTIDEVQSRIRVLPIR